MDIQKGFFDKYYWYPVIITAILCFGFTLTNYAIGVDDPTPQFIWYIDSKILLSQGRWGYELISPLVNISAFLPCWIDLISVGIYLITGRIWANLFAEASGGRYNKISAIIFSCLYISFPYLARIFIYMSADLLSAFNMLFASCGVWSIWKAFERDKGKKKNLFTALGCIVVGYGFYESVIIYFVCGTMIALLLKDIFISVDKLKAIIIRVIVTGTIVCVGVFCSRLILKGFLRYYNQYSSQYVRRYFVYNLKTNIIGQILQTIQELASAVFLREELVYSILRLSVGFILLLTVCISLKRKNAILVIIGMGVVVSNFALILGTGNLEIMFDIVQNKQRMLVTYGLFTSFSVSLIYSVVMEIMEVAVERNILYRKIQKFLKYMIIALSFVLVLRQSREMVDIFLADYQRSVLDRQKAGYINYEVEKHDWKNKPVIYVGFTEDYIATREKDPLSSYFHFFGQWTELENHNYISFYMSGLGYIYPAGLREGMVEDAAESSTDQPAYPMDGYVTEYENYIVVKLGEGT
ncbi:MAG: glucosyltransferase domain-containing protein [Eubacterium sp.]|nr:glucosyltransferase domain-containing protein [Eubacterium sp.]